MVVASPQAAEDEEDLYESFSSESERIPPKEIFVFGDHPYDEQVSTKTPARGNLSSASTSARSTTAEAPLAPTYTPKKFTFDGYSAVSSLPADESRDTYEDDEAPEADVREVIDLVEPEPPVVPIVTQGPPSLKKAPIETTPVERFLVEAKPPLATSVGEEVAIEGSSHTGVFCGIESALEQYLEAKPAEPSLQIRDLGEEQLLDEEPTSNTNFCLYFQSPDATLEQPETMETETTDVSETVTEDVTETVTEDVTEADTGDESSSRRPIEKRHRTYQVLGSGTKKGAITFSKNRSLPVAMLSPSKVVEARVPPKIEEEASEFSEESSSALESEETSQTDSSSISTRPSVRRGMNRGMRRIQSLRPKKLDIGKKLQRFRSMPFSPGRAYARSKMEEAVKQLEQDMIDDALEMVPEGSSEDSDSIRESQSSVSHYKLRSLNLEGLALSPRRTAPSKIASPHEASLMDGESGTFEGSEDELERVYYDDESAVSMTMHRPLKKLMPIKRDNTGLSTGGSRDDLLPVLSTDFIGEAPSDEGEDTEINDEHEIVFESESQTLNTNINLLERMTDSFQRMRTEVTSTPHLLVTGLSAVRDDGAVVGRRPHGTVDTSGLVAEEDRSVKSAPGTLDRKYERPAPDCCSLLWSSTQAVVKGKEDNFCDSVFGV